MFATVALTLLMMSVDSTIVATAILAGTGQPAVAQVWIYMAAAILFVVSLPLIARVPEHRGAW